MNLLLQKLSKQLILLLLAIVTIAVLPLQISAASLTSQFSSELYLFEENNESQALLYERLHADFSAWKKGFDKSLSFHTYLRYATEISGSEKENSRLNIYRAYLKYRGLPFRGEISLGRQFVYSSAGSSLIDGARIRMRFLKKFKLDIFGGSTVSSQSADKFQSISDYGLLGGRGSFDLNGNSWLAFNWLLRKKDGQVVYQRIGLDAATRLDHLDLYSRLLYNLSSGEISGIRSRISYNNNPWNISMEYDYHQPSVPDNTLFSLIEFYEYKDIRFDIQRNVYQNLALAMHLQTSLLKNDNSIHAGIGIRTGNYSIMWIHQNGYGGTTNSVKGHALKRLNRRWELFANANFNRYRVQELQIEQNDNYSAVTGLQLRPGSNWILRAETQYLRNAVKAYDIRFFLRISKNIYLNDRR